MAIIGTPKGPGPLKFVYDLNEVIYTITDMISTACGLKRVMRQQAHRTNEDVCY